MLRRDILHKGKHKDKNSLTLGGFKDSQCYNIKIRPILVFAIIVSVFLLNPSQVWPPNLIDVNLPL